MHHHDAPLVLPLMHDVRSSNIESVGYKHTTLDMGEIFVRFKPKPGEHRGELWRYTGCTRPEFDRLLHAASVGGHFHSNIRGRKTEHRVEERA